MSSVLHHITHYATARPEIVALSDGVSTVSYKDLPGKVADRAAQLQKAGCRVLGIAGDNSIDWLLWDLAAVSAGIVTVPLPPFFSAQQMQHTLAAAGVSHLAQGPALDNAATASAAAEAIPAGTAKITFTSGTTGQPKGVCLPQSALENVAGSIAGVLGAGMVKTHVCVLPLSILLENVAGVYTALLTGATVFVPPLSSLGFGNAFNPDLRQLAQKLSGLKDASVILVPELLRGLIAASRALGITFSGLKFAAVGGARVAPELINAGRVLGIPVYEGYGLSECGSVVSLNAPDAEKQDSCGRLLPHVKAEVRNGEIFVLDPGFLGYLGGDAAPGRFPTGDLGAISPDGFVVVSGRRKNLIITSFGRNISPEWIESRLLAEPGILQAMVLGEGEAQLRALIVPAPQADVSAAIARVNTQLPAYAQIGSYQTTKYFSPLDGTLTPNGRLVRQAIINRKEGETAMSFYETLQHETLQPRKQLYAVSQLVDALQGQISRETYIAYLTEAYHHVRHTVRFLMAMGARLPDSRKWMHDAISAYIDEEKGHEEWILNDIAAAGGDKEAARAATPRLETEVLVAYNYDYIARKNPVGFLGMVFMLESTSIDIATAGAKSLQSGLGLPATAFTYLSSHGSLDLEHMKLFEKLVNRVDDPADRAAILEVARNTFRLFANLLAAIPHKEAKRHAA
ncbi:MAG: AMP-binding protein [Alphaproteobacteria bacterium]